MSRFGSFWRSNTTTIGIVIIVIAFGTILFLQAVATSKLQEQTKQQTQILSQLKGVTDQLNRGAAQRTQQIATLTAHIDCIVTFFSQQDRTSTAIADINTCTLKNSNTGTSTQTQPTPSSTAPAATTPTNNSTSSTSPAPSTPSTATPTPEAAQPSFLDRLVVNPIKSIINGL